MLYSHIVCFVYQQELRDPTDKHIFAVAAALYSSSYNVDQLYEITKIDRWFLYKIRNIVNITIQLEACRDKVSVVV